MNEITRPTKVGKMDIGFASAMAGCSKNDYIRLDGVDIARCITAIELPHTAVGDRIEVRLTLLVLPGFTLSAASAYVGVSDDTANLLIDMGWTPPAMGHGEQDD